MGPEEAEKRPRGLAYSPGDGVLGNDPKSVLFVDPDVPRLPDEEPADHEGHQGHDDRIPKPAVDVSGSGNDGGGKERQHAPEPAVADVVRQGHGRVADP